MRIPKPLISMATSMKYSKNPTQISAEVAELTKNQVEKPVKLVYTHGAVAETTAVVSENGYLLGIKRGETDYFGTAWFDQYEVASVTDTETGELLFPFKQEPESE